jgi:Methyltransferase domain
MNEFSNRIYYANNTMMSNLTSKRMIKPRIERGSPDDLFVSKLAGVSLEDARHQGNLIRQDTEFRLQMERNLATGGRSGYIQICAPFELHALTTILRPKHVVEVGVSAGVSSAYFLHALESTGGTLHSIDLPERETRPLRGASWALPRGKNSGWAVPRSLIENWDLRLGRSSDVLPDLISEIDRVDLFLYDVPYEIAGAKADFAVVDRKLRRKSVALADNCQIPIGWWARRRGKARVISRKNSGLRGFSVT